MSEVTVQVPEEFKGLLTDVVERLKGKGSDEQARLIGMAMRRQLFCHGANPKLPTVKEIGVVVVDYGKSPESISAELIKINDTMDELHQSTYRHNREQMANRISVTDLKTGVGVRHFKMYEVEMTGLFLPHQVWQMIVASGYKICDLRMLQQTLYRYVAYELPRLKCYSYDYYTVTHDTDDAERDWGNVPEQDYRFVKAVVNQDTDNGLQYRFDGNSGGQPNQETTFKLLVYKNVLPKSPEKRNLGMGETCPDCGMRSRAEGHFGYLGAPHTEFECLRFSGLSDEQKIEFNKSAGSMAVSECTAKKNQFVQKVYRRFFTGEDDELGDTTQPQYNN